MNQNFLARLDELIGGTPLKVPIEKRILNYSGFFGVIVATFSILYNYLVGLDIGYFFPVFAIILFVINYYLSRIRDVNNQWFFIVVSMLIVGGLWITNLGVFGSYSYYFFTGLVIFLSIIRSKNHIYVIIVCILFYLFLLLYELYYPENILNPYKTVKEQYYDFAFSMILIIIIISLIINALKRSYEKEQRINLEQKAQIAAASEQKTNFFVNLAHETKTPLTLIENYLERFIETDNKNDLDIVKQNISKLNRDMKNFLDAEKLERGVELYNNNQIIDFSFLIKEKTKLFNIAAEDKGIRITTDIEKEVIVKSDSIALDRMVSNLIDNAIKYSESDTDINLSLSVEGQNTLFKIIDQGEGIDDDKLKNVFEPFYQLSHEKRNVEGVGMGLFIVKNIVEAIGGEIDIDSTLGKGTCFTITLPIHKLKPGEEIIREVKKLSKSYKEQGVDDSKFTSSKKTLLIVEDNLEMLAYLKDLMNEYNVFVAINGKHALEKLKAIPKPNLIISDIMMDEMDGYEFLHEISKNSDLNYIPFIFLTAKTSSEEKILALEKGAIDFISKPFSGDELKSKVHSLLESKNRYDESTMRMVIQTLTEKFLDTQQVNLPDDKWSVFEFKSKNYKLTDREIEVVKLLSQGLKRNEIAEKLYISPNTVTRHLQNVYDKTDVNNKTELIKKLFFN